MRVDVACEYQLYWFIWRSRFKCIGTEFNLCSHGIDDAARFQWMKEPLFKVHKIQFSMFPKCDFIWCSPFIFHLFAHNCEPHQSPVENLLNGKSSQIKCHSVWLKCVCAMRMFERIQTPHSQTFTLAFKSSQPFAVEGLAKKGSVLFLCVSYLGCDCVWNRISHAHFVEANKKNNTGLSDAPVKSNEHLFGLSLQPVECESMRFISTKSNAWFNWNNRTAAYPTMKRLRTDSLPCTHFANLSRIK